MPGHRIRLLVFVFVIVVIVAASLAYGFDYYRLGAQDRVFSGKHAQFRPSGSVGLRLGMIGVALFVCLYAYPVRKKWEWLQRFGKTRNWLDFHVVLGISAPLIITLHSSFKFRGLAGVAYWLMIVVMLSGFVGRYIYAQIPKSVNEATLTLDELEKLSISTQAGLAEQKILSVTELSRLLSVPDAGRVQKMSVAGALVAMMWRDAIRPLQTAALRRAAAGSLGESMGMWFGFRSSGNAEVEDAIRLVRRQSRLVTKLAFLGKADQMFQLWHVVHRPFSYSFLVLACLHVTLVLLMGYY